MLCFKIIVLSLNILIFLFVNLSTCINPKNLQLDEHQDGIIPERKLPYQQVALNQQNNEVNNRPFKIIKEDPNRYINNNGRDQNNINDREQIFTIPRTTASKPNSLVDQKDRLNVYWAEMYSYFALKASSDQKFMVRHAPIPKAGSPWPLPQYIKDYDETYLLNGADLDVKVTMLNGKDCMLIDKNIQRFHTNVFGRLRKKNLNANLDDKIYQLLNGPVYISINGECDHMPSLKMNESYNLRVQRSGIYLSANEVWGAIKGLETLSQLIYLDKNKKFVIKKVHIKDFPTFKHRGVLLDTSRHFLHKKTILENLEAMAQNKMNVFHWHIVDDQSFPYESKVFPNLTFKGAYNPYTHVYTQEDIRDIIEYARIRGIRVIPEFDTPGHTFSWGLGQQHLLTPCYDYSGKFNGLYGPINPILKKNYKFLRAFFREVMTVFSDEYIHLGGDEVPFDCWYSNPLLQNFIRRNNIRDMRTLLTVYVKQLIGIINEESQSFGKTAKKIVWQEMFENDVKLSADTIIQVWSGDAYMLERVLRSGLQAIFSTCWYLDYISYGQDWDKYYRCEQLQYHTFPNMSLFLGGEVCMWAEYVDNEGVMSRLWPRASAAAERLWSAKHVTDFIEAAPRLEMHRCRMLQRGIRVGVASGPGYCELIDREDVAFNVELEFESKKRMIYDQNFKSHITNTPPLNLPNRFLQIVTFVPVIIVSALIFLLIFTRHSRYFSGFLHLFSKTNLRIRRCAIAGTISLCLFVWIFTLTNIS